MSLLSSQLSLRPKGVVTVVFPIRLTEARARACEAFSRGLVCPGRVPGGVLVRVSGCCIKVAPQRFEQKEPGLFESLTLGGANAEVCFAHWKRQDRTWRTQMNRQCARRLDGRCMYPTDLSLIPGASGTTPLRLRRIRGCHRDSYRDSSSQRKSQKNPQSVYVCACVCLCVGDTAVLQSGQHWSAQDKNRSKWPKLIWIKTHLSFLLCGQLSVVMRSGRSV